MKLSGIYDRILFLLSVPKCVHCRAPLEYGDKGLCKACLIEYEQQKTRCCSRCSRRLPECNCSNFYLERHYVKRLVKVFRYTSHRTELAGNSLIYSLKQDNRRDTFAFLAEQLATSICASCKLEGNESKFLITNVPRRSKAVRIYGFDHGRELAKRIAKMLGIEYAQFLVSRAKTAQKGVMGDDRIKNAVFAYRHGINRSLKGISVILVDDVVTTGASMGACAALIRGMGTKNIIGASVSVAYKDSYKKPKSGFSK